MDAALSPLRQKRACLTLIGPCSSAIWNAWTQYQPSQELTVFQPANVLPGSSSQFDPNAGLAHARARSDNSLTGAIIQSLSFTSPQSLSEDAGPNGDNIISSSAGPATHVAPAVLAEA